MVSAADQRRVAVMSSSMESMRFEGLKHARPKWPEAGAPLAEGRTSAVTHSRMTLGFAKCDCTHERLLDSQLEASFIIFVMISLGEDSPVEL